MKKSLLNICGQDFFVKILDWILTTEKNLIWKSQEKIYFDIELLALHVEPLVLQIEPLVLHVEAVLL